METALETTKSVVRDDNLRLIFAPVEARLIEERILDIRAGWVLLVIFAAATGLFSWAAFRAGGHVFPELGLIGAAAILLWVIAMTVSVFSPLIAVMLGVEYVKTLRRQKEHLQLLERYGRGQGFPRERRSPRLHQDDGG